MCEYQWLTVISPEGLEGVELVLETMAFEPACIYQAVLFETGISGAALITKDVSGELQLLKALGVIFRSEPKQTGPITSAIFEDTCGNLINLVQPSA